jgi:hypothetical protein
MTLSRKILIGSLLLSFFVFSSCSFSMAVSEESFLGVLNGFDNVILTEDKFLDEFAKAIGSQQEGSSSSESLEFFKFHVSNFSSAVENLDDSFSGYRFGYDRPLVLRGYYDFYRPVVQDYLFFARDFSDHIVNFDEDMQFYFDNFQKLRMYSYKFFYVSNSMLDLMMDSEYGSSVLNLN